MANKDNGTSGEGRGVAGRDMGEGGVDEAERDGGSPTALLFELLLDLAVTVIEQAHEAAVAAVPNDRDGQLARAGSLRQAGADLSTLANAYEVLVRRQHVEINLAD